MRYFFINKQSNSKTGSILSEVYQNRKPARNSDIICLNMKILQVSEKSKYLKKPDNNNNYNHNVEDIFDFMIHRDVIIDKP